jgi:hypothetical protein
VEGGDFFWGFMDGVFLIVVSVIRGVFIGESLSWSFSRSFCSSPGMDTMVLWSEHTELSPQLQMVILKYGGKVIK